jgi:hypothetical protein
MFLVHLGIASVAAATLLYEVALTRLFSIASRLLPGGGPDAAEEVADLSEGGDLPAGTP